MRPAPGALVAPGQPQAAVADVAGVEVKVITNVWSGFPATLPDHTPVHVAIHNESGQPLLLRDSAFELVSPTGAEAAALPPLALEGSVAAPVPTPAFTYDRFWVAPYYAPYYPGIAAWGAPFDYDPLYYGRYYGYWRAPLPTPDMLAKAMPDGVLDNNGRIASFLYFPEIPEAANRVQFTMEIIDALTGKTLGMIRIPFVVEETELLMQRTACRPLHRNLGEGHRMRWPKRLACSVRLAESCPCSVRQCRSTMCTSP